MKKTLGILFTLILLAVIGIAGYGLIVDGQPPEPTQDQPSTEVEEDVEEGNIVIDSPQDGETVTSPITVTGRARVFEGAVDWRLRDGDAVLDTGFLTTEPGEIGELNPFSERIFIPVTDSGAITLELFSTSPMDGSEQDLVSVDLMLESTEKTSVNVYFFDEDAAQYGDCSAVDFEKRTVAATVNVAELAMLELLEGPTKPWAQTMIPPLTTLDSVTVEGGTAFVNLLHPNTLDYNGGACRVETIRAQIEQTMLQFSTVDDVVISVNGIVRDILQP